MESELNDPVGVIRATVEDLHLLTAAVRLYGVEHRHTGQIASQLERDLGAALGFTDELDVTITRDHLFWDDHAVYQDNDDKDGLARTLQREGIVRLTILPGTDRAELLTLAGILGLNLNLPRWEEETLSSLLWQADLQHVAYEAVEYLSDAQELSETIARGESTYVAEILRRMTDPEAPEPRGDERSSLDEEEQAPAPTKLPQAPSDVPLTEHEAEALEQARAQLSLPLPDWTPSQNMSALELDRWLETGAGELEGVPDLVSLRREAEADSEATLLERLVEVMVLGGARGRLEFAPAAAMALLTRALEWDPAEGSKLRRQVIDMVMRLTERDIPLVQPGRAAMNQWLDECTEAARFLDFATRLDSSVAADVQTLRQFLGGGGGQRAQLLVRRLGGMRTSRELGWVMDELARAVRDDLAPITAGIRHRPADEAYTLVDLLRRVDDPSAHSQLFELLRHDAPDIRAAVLRVLPYQLPLWMLPRVLELLVDREAVVRDAVVEMLRDRRSPEAWEALEEQVRGEVFVDAPATIKRSLAQALGAVDRDAAVGVFQGILARHARFFAGSGARAEVEAVALALARVGTVAARHTLLQAAQSPYPVLRKACRAALEERSSGG